MLIGMSGQLLISSSTRTSSYFVEPDKFHTRGCLCCAIYCGQFVQSLIEKVIFSMDSAGQKKLSPAKNTSYTRVSPSKWVPDKPDKTPSNTKRSPKPSKPPSSKSTLSKSPPAKSPQSKPLKDPELSAPPKCTSDKGGLVQDADGHTVDTRSIIPVKELTARLQGRMDKAGAISGAGGTIPKLEEKPEVQSDLPDASIDSRVPVDEEKGNDTTQELPAADETRNVDEKTPDASIDSRIPADEGKGNDTTQELPVADETRNADGKTMDAFMFEWSYTNAKQVFLAGSFNEWSKTVCPMDKVGDVHRISVPLESGKYLFKYVVDGEWNYDITLPTETDSEGNTNNVLVVM